VVTTLAKLSFVPGDFRSTESRLVNDQRVNLCWMAAEERERLPARGRVVFPSRVRNALFIEQRGRCRYCGRRMSNRQLAIDHKWPVSRNGGNEWTNLQLLCTACNLRKGIQTDEEFRDRYWRLLPTDEAIPDPPIVQEQFAAETRRTRASPTVRGMYRKRFVAARQRRSAQRGASPATLWMLPMVVLVLLLVAAVRSCG